jgi:hypothetical protein
MLVLCPIVLPPQAYLTKREVIVCLRLKWHVEQYQNSGNTSRACFAYAATPSRQHFERFAVLEFSVLALNQTCSIFNLSLL